MASWPVLLTSPHKKPFERLLFARRLANSESDGGVITAQPALIMPPDRFPPAQTSELSLRSSGLRNSECRSLRSQVHRVVSARRAFAEAISGRTSAALRAGYSQSEFAARWGGGGKLRGLVEWDWSSLHVNSAWTGHQLGTRRPPYHVLKSDHHPVQDFSKPHLQSPTCVLSFVRMSRQSRENLLIM